ncbi:MULTISPECIES: hypothetical protein [unclassified Micromonospora]|uniref:hypothetical protein n=1 Tax=unclassified Micromonospora TaxID=2617518 RepID=UPI00098D2ACB|nr:MULTISPECIES: hypothetical protein [unclassified Micromonospora]MDI5936761.1 hypothetical protein [Micromonospora sp. DH15]OON28147.1 hypothetical protein BSA16_28280 [Micromonospora sp. Rc5]
MLLVVWFMPVSTGTDAGSYEATAIAAVAAITAALLVVVPAVFVVAIQTLSQFSWRTVRVLADRRMAAWVVLAAVVGVCLPLGLAVNPSPLTTRIAFTCFIMSILIVAWVTWNGARHATPEWLVSHVSDSVLHPRGRWTGGRPKAARHVTVLGDLVGSPRLPVREHRLAAVTWVIALAAQTRAGADIDDIAQALREVGADLSREVSPDHQAAIAAIAAFGMHMSGSRSINEAVVDVLFDLAVQNRASGRHQVAAEALDAVVDAVSARLAEVTPQQRVLTVVHLPSSSADLQRTAPVSRSRLAFSAPGVIPPAQTERDRPTFERVNDLVRQPMNVADLNELLTGLSPDRISEQPFSRDALPHSYELLEATVDRLVAVLTSPTPSSTGWSGGYHEASGFTADVERLGRLGRCLFTGQRYSRCDAIETHLETVAARLIRVDTAPYMPLDRTGWRIAHLARRPSPASVIATTLRDLAIEAFEAGYDRRALLTGRRLLSLATAAAVAGDDVATHLYTEAIYILINRTAYHNRSAAVVERGALIIAGLIRESDDLRRALPAEGGHPDGPAGMLRMLPWQAFGFEFVLATAAWQSELRAAGWLPGDRIRQPDRTLAGRLSPYLYDMAFEELGSHLAISDSIYPTALLLTLWADAVVARTDGDDTPAIKLAAYLADQLAELDDDQDDWDEPDAPLTDDEWNSRDDLPRPKSINAHLRRIVDTIIIWVQGETSAAPAIPSVNEGTRHLLSVLAEAARNPGFQNWTYHGVADTEGSSLVVIQYPDEERILLRNQEAGASGLFAWGYSGNGPHTLADALATHVAGTLRRCTDCFGASPITWGLIDCAACANSGNRPGLDELAMLLTSRVIASLPKDPDGPSALPNVMWTTTRAELIQSATGPRPSRTPRTRPVTARRRVQPCRGAGQRADTPATPDQQ